MEGELSTLNQLKASHEDLKTIVLTMMAGKEPVPVSTNNYNIPGYISSELLQRERSDSVRSSKRNLSSDSEMDVYAAEGDFSVPKDQDKRNTRHEKRRKLSEKPTFANTLANGTPKDTPYIQSFNWGKSAPVATGGFAGSAPDAFLYRCDPTTEPHVIKNHLINKGIKVKTVEIKSHRDAPSRSFRVSVESSVDFDKLISGENIPKYVKVKEYVNFNRRSRDSDGWDNSAKKPAYVYNSRKESTSGNPRTVMSSTISANPSINLFNELGNLVKESEAAIKPPAAVKSTTIATPSTSHSIDNLISGDTTGVATSHSRGYWGLVGSH